MSKIPLVCLLVDLREHVVRYLTDTIIVERVGPLSFNKHEDKRLHGFLKTKRVATGGERLGGDGRRKGLEYKRIRNAFGGGDLGKRGVENIDRVIEEVDIILVRSGNVQLTWRKKK